MRNRWGTRLTVAVSALAAAGLGLVSAGAGAASAAANPGTTGPGSWTWATDGPEAITHTTAPPTVSYTATVQQPINAPGQIPSVFSNKTRTIPVKYTVQKCTTPGASQDHYPGLLDSENTGTPSFSDAIWYPPSSANLTVGQVKNLTANFSWVAGGNSAGSMRWVINTNLGNVDVYYGEPFNTGGFPGSPTVDSGTNMITDASTGAPNPARVDYWGAPNTYDTWNNVVLSDSAVANEPVNWVALIVDSGYNGTEQVQLSTTTPAITIDTNATTGDSTYTPGDVTGGGGSQTCATDTTDNFWLYLAKVSGSTPPAPIDENLIDNTQGDSGGQFRLVNGFYMYNLPLSQLTDLTAQYQIGISPNNDGSNPAGVVQFGLK
jgi:hypothetical protein